MKSGFYTSVPGGMVFKKHYCHKCGERLQKNPNKRLVSRNDPDYGSYRIGRFYSTGDIEVTEYNFLCPNCGNIIEYDEQVVIGKIQKKLGCDTLSESQIEEIRGWADEAVARNEKKMYIASKIIFALIIAAVLICSIIRRFYI